MKNGKGGKKMGRAMKKTTAVVVCMIMILGLIPNAAAAEETEKKLIGNVEGTKTDSVAIFSVSVENSGNLTQKGQILVANYNDDGTLTAAKCYDEEFETGVFEESYEADITDGYAKIYVWDEKNSPITEALSSEDLEYKYAETVYSITGLKIDGDTARVTVNADDECYIVLAFLDENDNSVIGTVSEMILTYCEMTEIEMSLSEVDLPKNFLAEAVLKDEKNNDLCSPFKFIEYTSEYEAFSLLTTDDFEEDRVLNFDDDAENNFGVLNDNVESIIYSDMQNMLSVTVDEISGETYYTFLLPDEDIKSVSEGDLLYIEQGGYLIKAANVVSEDNCVTIAADSSAELNDFYDVIKIDMDVDSSSGTVDENDSGDAKLMQTVLSADGDWTQSAGATLTYELSENVKISGSIKGTCGVKIKMFYDTELFGEDYVYCSVIVSTEFEVGLNIVAKTDAEASFKDEFKMAGITIPTNVPGLSIYINPVIPIDWSLVGGGYLNYKYMITTGFNYDTNSGYQTIEEKNQNLDFSLEGEAELSFGPKIAFGIQWGAGTPFMQCSFDVHCGAKVTAKSVIFEASTKSEEYQHACALCIDGKVKYFVNASVKLDFKLSKKLTLTVLDLTLIYAEAPMRLGNETPTGSFFISIINDEESIYKGEVTFGLGECQNKKWRTTFRVLDSEKNECVRDVEILYADGSTAAAGMSDEIQYLYDGDYIASMSNSENDTSTDLKGVEGFVVDGQAQEVEVELSKGCRFMVVFSYNCDYSLEDYIDAFEAVAELTPEALHLFYAYGKECRCLEIFDTNPYGYEDEVNIIQTEHYFILICPPEVYSINLYLKSCLYDNNYCLTLDRHNDKLINIYIIT